MSAVVEIGGHIVGNAGGVFGTGNGGASGFSIVNGRFSINGVPSNPRGFNVYGAGYENGTTNLYDFTGWQGTPPLPLYSTLTTLFKSNIVRLTLDAQAWLSHDCLVLSSIGMTNLGVVNGVNNYALPSSVPGDATYVNKNSDGLYQQKILAQAAIWNTLGYVVVIDCHCTAPQVVIAGTTYSTHNLGGSAQMPLAPLYVTDFWTSVTTAFKGNQMVAFDLFNEPGSNGNVNWALWKNGGTFTAFPYDDNNNLPGNGSFGSIQYSWTALGHEVLYQAVRAVDSTRICIFEGIEFGAELGDNGFQGNDSTLRLQLQSFVGSDTQVAASVHLYPSSASAYGSTNYFQYFTADNAPPPYKQFQPWVADLLANNIPVLFGEFAGASGSSSTYPNEPFVSTILAYIDSINNASTGSIASTWWTADPQSDGSSPIVYSGATVVAQGGTGSVIQPWSQGHAAP